MSEESRLVEAIVQEMGLSFREGVFADERTFCFKLGETALTVTIDARRYLVERGAPDRAVHCSCRTGAEMFERIWYHGYRPGIMDFLGGGIKCDAPLLLPQFLRAFGR